MRAEVVKGRIRMWCKDCKQWFIIDPDVPLDKQVSEHTWSNSGRGLRHITDEEYRDARADAELCPECGCYPCEHTRGIFLDNNRAEDVCIVKSYCLFANECQSEKEGCFKPYVRRVRRCSH